MKIRRIGVAHVPAHITHGYLARRPDALEEADLWFGFRLDGHPTFARSCRIASAVIGSGSLFVVYSVVENPLG